MGWLKDTTSRVRAKVTGGVKKVVKTATTPSKKWLGMQKQILGSPGGKAAAGGVAMAFGLPPQVGQNLASAFSGQRSPYGQASYGATPGYGAMRTAPRY